MQNLFEVLEERWVSLTFLLVHDVLLCVLVGLQECSQKADANVKSVLPEVTEVYLWPFGDHIDYELYDLPVVLLGKLLAVSASLTLFFSD